MDLRRGVRYPVELDCFVSPVSDPSASEPGKTVNMSSCGVLISFDRIDPTRVMPQLGDVARVVVELPNAPYFRGCRLECKCRVVRVDQQADTQMVAFDVKRYHFRPVLRDAPAEPPTDTT